MRLSRRSLLTGAGGVAAGAAVGAGVLRALGQQPQSAQELLQEWSSHEEEFRVSICQQCPGGCGVLARVVDGKLVRIAGNPLHPVNQGGLCMKGIAGTQVLYDPDRLRQPLQRDGKRGEGRWKPIAWEPALDLVAGRLRELRRGGHAHTVALLGGQYRGLVDGLFDRFCRAYGTPNYLRLRCMDYEQAGLGAHYLQGLERPPVYDLEHSRYILSFGCNLLESWLSTVHQLKAYGRLRERPDGVRAQLVMVDPRFSPTAAKADLWLPVNPGTDAALALGLAYIIIQEGRYDAEFIRERSFGFDDWTDPDGTRHLGFKRMVLEEYPPETVSAITGVPVARLFQVARGFAGRQPAVALGDRGPAFQANDLPTRMAIYSLNALVGSIGRVGGVAVQGTLPLAPWSDVHPDAVARTGLAHPRIDRSGRRPLLDAGQTAHRLPAQVLSGQPYGLNALFLYYTNPLFSLPEREQWARALEKIPLIVSFSPFLDETSQQADLILPDCTYLERWRDDEITHLAGITAFSVGPPVVPPLHDTRATEDVLLQLAGKLGEPVAGALPWPRFSDLLREKAQGLYEAERGHIAMAPPQEHFESILARQGYWQRQFATYDEFWEELQKKGVWWDPNDTYIGPRQLFKTPSNRFEFHSQLLRADLERLAGGEPGRRPSAAELGRAARSRGLDALGDRMFLPHHSGGTLSEPGNAYPFVLNTYKLMSLAGGRGGNQPWLQQQPAVHVENGWDSWVEINPAAAAERGIEDGDTVWLESSRGKIAVRARILAGTAPGMLNMPFGWGHEAYGRWARNRGQNPNRILDGSLDAVRGIPAWAGTRVRLTKA